MKTLEQAQKSYNQKHYRLICHRCKVIQVANEEDIDSMDSNIENGHTLKLWKCPNCGHNNKTLEHVITYNTCDAYGNFLSQPEIWL